MDDWPPLDDEAPTTNEPMLPSGELASTVTTTTSGHVAVGPGTIARHVPRSARISVTGTDPYDVDVHLNWDDDEQRLVVEDVRITRRPDGPAVRASELTAIKFGQLVEDSLAAEVLDDRGWKGIVEDHPHGDPAAVDTLIYSLAHAVGGQRPTQTVARARGLQPGSAIKRVMRARELGYLGKATKGRSGGLANGGTAN
jgi:hypothetical protein